MGQCWSHLRLESCPWYGNSELELSVLKVAVVLVSAILRVAEDGAAPRGDLVLDLPLLDCEINSLHKFF